MKLLFLTVTTETENGQLGYCILKTSILQNIPSTKQQASKPVSQSTIKQDKA